MSVIPLRKFGGMFTNPQGEDIPDFSSEWNINVDPQTQSQFRGIIDSGAAYQANGNVEIPDATESAFLKYNLSGTITYDLVFIDKAQDHIKVVEDFYNTEANRTFTSQISGVTGTANSIKMFNNAAQIGAGAGVSSVPVTVFRLEVAKTFWNNNETKSAGLYDEFARCRNRKTTNGDIYILSIAESTGSDPKYFLNTIYYSWGISIVYDGVQESNLVRDSSNAAEVPTNAAQNYTITIKAHGGDNSFGSFDSRMTAIKIYRAESSDKDPAHLGLYRLVKTISIDDGSWTVDGTHAAFVYTDPGGYPEGGATYEAETGILETTDSSYVHYNINEVGGGYHWMAQCYVPYTQKDANWDRYIFRSEKYRPNMVNWVEGNHLTLPEIPVELKWYNNKLYAFTENWIYRINPELLVVEDALEGFGVSKKGGVLVTEYGMFGCNINGAWVMRGNQIDPISDNIKMGLGNYTDDNWLKWAEDALVNTSNTLGRIIVGYIADKRCVIFMGNEPGAATTLAFVYYIPTTEWFMWDFGGAALDTTSGMVTGKDGELYWSGTTVMNQLLAGSGNEDAEWVSKEFTLNKPSQDKLWRKVVIDVSDSGGTETFKYATEGSDPVSGTTITSGSNINVYKKTFQVYMKTTGASKIDSLDILVRDLIGER